MNPSAHNTYCELAGVMCDGVQQDLMLWPISDLLALEGIMIYCMKGKPIGSNKPISVSNRAFFHFSF